MTRILLALLAFYRRWLSPALHSLGPGGCRYLPTCSEYAPWPSPRTARCAARGLAVWRLLRCHPFTRGGLDPVPPTRSTATRSKTFSPTNRYHRKSGSLTAALLTTGSILCPKFRIPISKRRVPAAAAAAAICARPSPSRCWPWLRLSATSTSSSPRPRRHRRRKRSRNRKGLNRPVI